jgi:hypothetical protein
MHSISASHFRQHSEDPATLIFLKVSAEYATSISRTQLGPVADGEVVGGAGSAHLFSENARPGVILCQDMTPFEIDRGKLETSPAHSMSTFPPSLLITPAWIAAGQMDECIQ